MMHEKNKKVKIEKLCKKFNMETKKEESILSFLLSIFSKKNYKELQVLKDFSLDIYSGQVLGIVGDNGSGKSTLLKIIAGIYEADSGTVKVFGDSVYLSGFGQGLVPKLTMRENIYLMGSVMGLSSREIKQNFLQIVEFSGLKDFVDNKVFQFSSGMVIRLAFSATIAFLSHKNPQIVLLDEVFDSGGDIEFREKAIAKMEEFVKGQKAVVLVSHQMDTVRKYADRVLWIKDGKAFKLGNTNDVLDQYIYENSNNNLH